MISAQSPATRFTDFVLNLQQTHCIRKEQNWEEAS